MAEFLVQNKRHWMDEVDRSKWDYFQLEKHMRRNIKGNPIVVKPNGWRWGKAECPPNYVVIKVPEISLLEAELYTEPWHRICEFEEIDSNNRIYSVAAKIESISKREAITENEQIALNSIWAKKDFLIIDDIKYNRIIFIFKGYSFEEQQSVWIQGLKKSYPQCSIKDLGYTGKVGSAELIFNGKVKTELKLKLYTETEQKDEFLKEEGMWKRRIKRRRWILPELLLIHNSEMSQTQFLSSIVDRKQQKVEKLI